VPELTIYPNREDETRMRTLSAIEEFNADGTNPGDIRLESNLAPANSATLARCLTVLLARELYFSRSVN
jgi:hypothetical protein